MIFHQMLKLLICFPRLIHRCFTSLLCIQIVIIFYHSCTVSQQYELYLSLNRQLMHAINT